MKPEDFKKIVRAIVQEELKKQLPQLIPQILSEALTGKSIQPVPVVQQQRVQRPQVAPRPQPPKEPKVYAKNPLINQILNETVVKIKPDPTAQPFAGLSESLVSSVDSKFEYADEQPVSSDTGDDIDYSLLNESVAPSAPVVADIQPQTEEQAKVLGKINRDFRSMMKTIDAKKRNGVNPFGGGLEFDNS
jgi:hypothetical protein